MKIKVLFVVIISILLQIIFISVYAVIADPNPTQVTQPDGTLLTIRLHGDEFYHYRTTEDGYLIKQNAEGYYTYARINTNGILTETQIIARDVFKRSSSDVQFLNTVNKTEQIQGVNNVSNRVRKQANLDNPQKVFPSNGSPKSIVILVNFSDKSFVTTSTNTAFTNLLNQENYSANGGTGSAKDYFMASSYGKFSPNFEVVGPYTLPNNMAYYGANDVNGDDVNATQMIVDACSLAYNAGLDFSKYDTDNDGVIDNVFVYFAGYNEAEHGPDYTIWPHRSSVVPGANYSGTKASITFNGKLLYDYACTSELRGSAGSNMCGIGTFCHEFSHVIGLKDYYHTTDSKNKPTIGSWSLMASGNYLNDGRTPPTYSVFDRTLKGWLTPQEINSPAELFLLPIYQGKTQPANTNNQAFQLSGGANPYEFFLLEYRKKTGWDSYLPAEGMLIWHIDIVANAWSSNSVNNYTGTTQTAESHMGVFLESSAGWSPSPTSVGSPFPSEIYDSFIPRTWSGVDINRTITDIKKIANQVSFKFMPVETTFSGYMEDFTSTKGTPSITQTIGLTASNLTNNLKVELQSGVNFDIKLSAESSWSKSINIPPISSQFTVSIDLRYNPITDGMHTDELILTTTGYYETSKTFSGRATTTTNPVIITQVYGGGGNSGSTYKSDFVELYNTTNSDVNIGNWSLYYIAATSSSTSVKYEFPTNTIVKAGKYFALKCADGTGTQPAWNITFDGTSSLALGGTSGKLVLLNNNNPFTLTTPATIEEIVNNEGFVDYVAYGTTAIPIWGSAMTSNLTSSTSARRKYMNGSFQYTKNIGNDFEVVTADPRNSSIVSNTETANNSIITIFAVNKTIYINGADNNETIEIYGTTGLKVYSSEVVENKILLDKLLSGIYIVRIGMKTFKVKL